jgi:hypothetical protein
LKACVSEHFSGEDNFEDKLSLFAHDMILYNKNLEEPSKYCWN